MTEYSDLTPKKIQPLIAAVIAAKDIERYAELNYGLLRDERDERDWNLKHAAGRLADDLYVLNKPTDAFDKLIACIEAFSDDELESRGSSVYQLVTIQEMMFPEHPMSAGMLATLKAAKEDRERRRSKFDIEFAARRATRKKELA